MNMNKLKNMSWIEGIVILAISAVVISLFMSFLGIGPTYQVTQNGQAYVGTVFTDKYGNVTVWKKDGGFATLSQWNGPIEYKKINK